MRAVRAAFACSLLATTLLVAVPTTGGAATNTTKACKSLDGLQDDLSEVGQQLDDAFDGDVFTAIGKAFKKAAKSAPKSVRSSLKALGKFYSSIGDADGPVDAARLVAQGTQKYTKAATDYAQFYAEECFGVGTGSTTGSTSGSGGGELMIDSETITLDRSICYLREQVAAGQTIELTAQAYGTTADGDDLVIDFTRYAEGEQFEGDDISIDIGSLTQPSAQYNGSLDYGTVERSGSTLSASDVEMSTSDGSTATVSFEIEC